jgi:hypothetical protein
VAFAVADGEEFEYGYAEIIKPYLAAAVPVRVESGKTVTIRVD